MRPMQLIAAVNDFAIALNNSACEQVDIFLQAFDTVPHIKHLYAQFWITAAPFGLHTTSLTSTLWKWSSEEQLDLLRTSTVFTIVLLTLGWNSLVDRCSKLRDVMIFKIIHKIVDIQRYNYLATIQLPTRGRHYRFHQLSTYIDSASFHFSLKEYENLEQFVRTYTYNYCGSSHPIQLFRVGLHLT